MVRAEDHSSEHFDWLVAGRSCNQTSTARLYRIIEEHTPFLQDEVALQKLAQDLAAIAFSLWRAVFLSDLTGELGNELADARRFLCSLIAHNAVLYQTDYNSREWAFKYYLENALFRLQRMATSHPSIVLIQEIERPALTAKEDWTNAQAALDAAISNFANVIVEHDRRRI